MTTIVQAPTASVSCDPSAAISIRDLSHFYPPPSSRRSRGATINASAKLPALDGVSFDVNPGEIFGILGPNGSGKTTLFRVLATLLRPRPRNGALSGQLSIFGCDVVTQSASVRRHLGVMFQMPSLDHKLTAAENLMHHGHLYGLHGPSLRARINELLERFGLDTRRGEYVERFSGGMRRRVELAKALLHQPRLLLLDEPATGLDPGARRDLWNLLSALRREQGVTVALTTHLMEEADRCDRLAVMCRGRVAALNSPDRLKDAIGGDVITIEPDDPEDIDDLRKVINVRFSPWPPGGEPAVHGGRIHLEKPDGAAFVATLSGAVAGRTRSITVGKPTLEDVFLHLTGHTLWE